MAEEDDPKRTPLKAPVKTEKNIQATKYYVFNETGNIMMASTDSTTDAIQQSVRDVFAEVSVFFAAMTKAISTTKNPKDPNGGNYSLYNYAALEQVIDGSGLFVHVTEEDIQYDTESYGVDFSKQLIESLLGLATGEGELAFASAMVASMGSEGLRINANASESDAKVANIVFVCEYLLGMPVVSAIVVYADVSKNIEHINAGPCFSYDKIESHWKLHKDTYMFVTPTFIQKYAGDLEAAETNPEFAALVDYLKGTLSGAAVISAVQDESGTKAPGALTASTAYVILGENFGSSSGTLKLATGSGVTFNITNWSPSKITFTFTGTSKKNSAIQVFAPSGTTPLVATPEPYTFTTIQ